jgi:hypothetical protein
VTISATLGGITGSTPLTVTPAEIVSIAITPATPSVTVGIDQQLNATATLTDHTTVDVTTQVTWGSSDTEVAIVGNSSEIYGVVTGQSVGTATITATLDGITGAALVTVTSATLVSLEVTPTNPSLALGLTRPFTATGTFSDGATRDLTAQVTWASSNTDAATISNAPGEEGVASAGALGTTTISATLTSITGSTDLTVTPAELVQIDVTPAEATVAKGLTQQYKAIGTFSDTTTQNLTTQVTWASSDRAVATISNAAESEGLASAGGIGPTTISASLNGITGSAPLTVTAASLTSITVTPTNPSLSAGLDLQFTAKGTFSDATVLDITTQVTWDSSAIAVASISNAAGSEGLATGLTAATTTISATLGTITGQTQLKVTPAVLLSIKVGPSEPFVATGQTLQLTATGTFSDGSTQDLTAQVTWISQNTALATVSNAAGSQGLATGTGAGVVDITATLGAVSGTVQLNVTGPQLIAIAVTSLNPTLMQQQRLQLRAVATYSDSSTQDVTATATWASDATNVATVGTGGANNGRVDAQQTPSTANVTATVGAVTGTTKITVNAIGCHIVINEVQAGGGGTINPAADEWVELYNPCTVPFDTSTWTLVYRAAVTVGATDTSTLGTVGGTMLPGAIRLHAHVASQVAGIATVLFGSGTTGTMQGANAAVGLRAGPISTGTLVDSVAYGTVSAGHPFAEGGIANAAPGLLNGKSISRAPYDGRDSNVNITDFVLTTTPTPRAVNFP